VVHTKLLTTPILLQHKSGQGRSYIWGTCFHDCCLNQSINHIFNVVYKQQTSAAMTTEYM